MSEARRSIETYPRNQSGAKCAVFSNSDFGIADGFLSAVNHDPNAQFL